MKYFVEKGSGYEFGMQGDEIFITKSPKSKASREKPAKVKKDTKAYSAIKKFIVSQIKKDDKQDEETPSKKDDKSKDRKTTSSELTDSEGVKWTRKDEGDGLVSYDDGSGVPVTLGSDPDVFDRLEQEYNEQESPAEDTTPAETSEEEAKFKSEKESSEYKLPQGVVLKDFSEFKERTWLSGEDNHIDAVQINGKNYFSYGYVRDTNTGKTGIAVKMTYEEARELSDSSGKSILAILAPMKAIKPARGTFTVPFKRGKGQKNVYLVPWDTAGVKIYVTILDTLDGATIAAKLQIIGDVVGAIPVVGFVGDFSGMTIELLKPDRNFFIAALYALGALPLLGEGIVLLKASKAVPKIAAKATANEAALKLASKLSGDVDSFQKIGKTIRGSSLTKKLVDFAPEFEAFFRKNIPQLEAIGIRLSEELVDNFFVYFNKFVNAYKRYIALKPVVLLGKFKNLVAVAERPVIYTANETVGKELQKYVESIDLYKLTGINPTDNPFDDAVKIAKNLDSKLVSDAITDEIAVANIKFNKYLESSAFSKFLDTKPDATKITESMIINEKNLRALIRSLI